MSAPAAAPAAAAAAADSSASAATTESILEVPAADLTPEQFVRDYVERNRPVIVTGALATWKATVGPETSDAAADDASGEWTIPLLQARLGAHPLRNVFIASARHQRRFKFFKASAASAPTATSPSSGPEAAAAAAAAAGDATEAGLQRAAMTFEEFVRAANEAKGKPDGDAYYLYGEPMPEVLAPSFPVLPILSAVGHPLTSTLLWVSPAPTVSPLHYDLSEGTLAQVHGSKRVTLIAPQFYEELYPHPVQHAHDRQSQVDDIHVPSADAFPHAVQLPRQMGVVSAGSLLYIPYGWWHQLESIDTSISISQRWNPHADALQRLAAAWHVTGPLPAAMREQICQAHLQAVPPVVAAINRRRWDELAKTK